MTENILLDTLKNKVIDLLERYKDPLIQVVRYRDKSWFVPKEIEIPTKYIIKNFHKIPDNDIHHDESIEFSIERKNNTMFHIYFSEQEEPYIVNIEKHITPITQYGSYRRITYRGKTYEELILSGNTYNHILSQADKIQERTTTDQETGLLTPTEAQKLYVYNLFHDIPEYKKGDIICSSKTDKHRKEEDDIAEEIIHKQDRSSSEKDLMREVSLLHKQNGLFKLYEIMFYIFDIQNMINNKDFYNNSCHLAGATLGSQLPRLIKEYELPNGNKIYGLDVSSCTKHLYDHIDFIDNAFAHVDEIGILDTRNTHYEEGKKIRNQIIKPYITNKIR